MQFSLSLFIKNAIVIIMLSGILNVNTNLKAQIIYTDLEPDLTSNSTETTYELDINNDGVTNFILEASPDPYAIIYPNTPENEFIRSENQGWITLVEVLNAGTSVKTLNSPFSWNNWPGLLFIGCYISIDQCLHSNWTNQTDKYIGISFKIDGNLHYGWIRMDVSDNTHWTIKDYAYNATPEEDLLTGVTTFLNMDDLQLLKQIKLITAHKKITALNLTEKTNISLYTITGNHLLTATLNPDKNVIPITTLASGIYIVKLKNMNNGLSSARKIILE